MESIPTFRPSDILLQLFRALCFCLVIAVGSCGPGPGEVARPSSSAVTETGSSFLAQRVEALGDPGDGRSGLHVVGNGPEALALRLILSERAEAGIDAQYYILTNDTVGHLFVGELLKAADRGVRVRLLLDDMYTAEYDAMSVALTRHPNIELRLFNPFRRGIIRPLDGLFEFDRINRRMHNKSMTFDNQVSIVGGRNIANEYFSADSGSNYDDIDLLAAGPVAREVSASFDLYWNSAHAVPAGEVIGDGGKVPTLAEARAQIMSQYEAAKRTVYGAALSHEVRGRIEAGRMDLDWAPASALADDPDKAAGRTDGLLAADILPILHGAQKQVIITSAYFMPGERGTDLLTSLARRGVHVVIQTNSLDSNDVAAVHGHYSHYRKELLRAGVELWELRPDKDREDRSILHLGQSLSGLHSKAFAVDGRRLFIGSFNWDPRSVAINTEMGILVDSPAMTREALGQMSEDLAASAYMLRLNDAGQIEWLEKTPKGGWLLYPNEPSRSGWHKFTTRLLGMLPIAGQL